MRSYVSDLTCAAFIHESREASTRQQRRTDADPYAGSSGVLHADVHVVHIRS